MDGGDGDDYLYGGQNAGATEVMIGGTGNDHIYGESGIDEIAGGEGDDYIDAGGDTDLVFAGAGNDEMYGGEGPDELHGDLGDDLISGGSGTDKLLGEQGDDILYGGQGGGVSNGDSDELIGGDPSLGVASDTGFDIANYADSSIALNVAADLTKQQLVAGINGVPSQPFNHLYMGIDGIVGSKFDDKFAPSATNLSGAGLIGDDTGNWLVGGSGNDTMLGGGGNDIIVGGSIRLDKLIGTYSGGYTNDVDGATHRAIGPIGTNGFLDSAALGGQFDKHFTDLLRSEARKDYVLGDGGANGTADTAVLSGDRSNYTVVALDISGNVIADPVANIASVFAVKITDNGGGGRTILDGTDLVIGVQNFAFADGSRSLIQLFNHAPTGRVDFTAVFGPNVVGNNAQDANAVRLTGRSAIYDQDNILGSNLLGAILTSAVTFSWTDNLIVPITTVGSGTSNYVDGQGRLVLHTTGGVIVNETGSYVDAGGFSESVTTTWNMIVGTSGANAGLTGTNSAVIGDAIFGLAGTDTLNGGDGNDQLYGGSGTDTLNGGTGNDYLDGGDGGDTMVGGSGDDTYVVNSASDIVTELFNGGIDTVLASVSYTLGANVENLTLTGNNNISGTGNTLDNIIIGNSGNNTLNGGIGIDTVAYTGSVLRASFSLPGADIVVAMPANGNDTLQSIEKLMFGGDTFNLVVGSNVANGALTGGAGADLILGFGGNDTLSGNGGNDVLIGGANAAGGHDTLTGGLGADTFVFATGDSGNAALTRDVITDFAGSDRIELSLWDAISGGGANFGDQDFAVGTLPTGFLNGFHVGSFTGSGQLRYSASGADTLIEGNTNGNNANSEFHILLQGYNSLNGLHHVVDASGDYIIV